MGEAWNLDRNKVLSISEVDALLTYLRSNVRSAVGRDRDSAVLDEVIVVALLLSGLRSSEFCGLAVGDVERNEEGWRLMVRGGGGASRVVYIPGWVGRLISHYVDDVRPRFLPRSVDAGDRREALVFSERRRAFERTGLYRRVVRILTDAGLGERASVQLLRHTYGYLAYLRTGGNLLFVQRQLGHAHPRITSVYAQLVEESYAEMAERVAAGPSLETPGVSQGRRQQCRPTFDCETD